MDELLTEYSIEYSETRQNKKSSELKNELFFASVHSVSSFEAGRLLKAKGVRRSRQVQAKSRS